jgi:type IV pilus assembly protein PilV
MTAGVRGMRARRQTGMTLVEVLVTLVLTSVGLLGVAALQLTTLKGNQEAFVRSQASVLAGYILDRMRANQQAFRDGDYEVDFNGVGGSGTAGLDLDRWQDELDRLLPGSDDEVAGRIVRTPGTRIVTITVRWGVREDRILDNPNAPQPTSEFQTRTEI